MEESKQVLSTRKFGLKDKLCYASGDIANDFTFMLMSSWMLKFYTDIMGVEAALVGGLMAAARIVDAFTDIGMGTLVDGTDPSKSKFGKFRIWMLRGAIPCVLLAILVFAGSVVADSAYAVRVAWMFVTYILWGSIFYTCVNIPYGSMASSITDDPHQRTQLSSARSIGAIIANLGIGVAGPLLVYNADSELVASKVLIFAIVCGLLALCFYAICIFGSVDRVYIPAKKRVAKAERAEGEKGIVMTLLTDKALILLIIGTVFMLMTQMAQNSMAGYVFPNYYKNTTAQSIASMVGCVMMIAIAAFAPKLARKFGKRELGFVSMFAGAVVYLVAFILRPESVWVYIVIQLFAYMALGAFSAICFAMIIDVIDNAEVKNGKRDDGKYYGVYSFARKLGQAGASLLTGSLLTAVGYSDATKFEASVTTGIYNIATLVPTIGFAIAGIFLVFYPLKKSQVDNNSEILRQRRENS
ncbi:MAG: glycoside-pentoside-hexuronide (GPH):cation symporter [Oscillospiraceae bacterium]|nr:glycoside-pentoside-hexuronide (GPH):cation symporter [Oscillospiraceae bacterium]